MSSTVPRADLRLLTDDPGQRWRLTITGTGLEARLTANYTASCGGTLEIVFSRLYLQEAPRRLRLSATSGTRFEARADGLVSVDEALSASRALMARVMGGSLETLAPGAPCGATGRRRRR